VVHPTFAVLADPARCRIVGLLLSGEQPVGEVSRALRIAQPSVSKHLKALERIGLVAVRRDAQRRLYRLQPGPLAALDAWLTPYRRLWADRLDALERRLDALDTLEEEDE
jgi:DNA-binding transcriptional ArsR family regulator